MEIFQQQFNFKVEQKNKLKVLCLHGYQTNSDLMEIQMKQWKEVYFKKQIEFVYLNAPHKLPEQNISDPKLSEVVKKLKNKQLYSWFSTLKQLEKTLQYIEQFMNENGPFDGLCGFSQGGNATAKFAMHYQQGKINLKYPLKFVIMICATFPDMPAENNNNLLNGKSKKSVNHFQLDIPSLHLVGENDYFFQSSLVSTTLFINPEIIFHNGVPRLDAKDIRQVKKFLRKSMLKYQKNDDEFEEDNDQKEKENKETIENEKEAQQNIDDINLEIKPKL
ncbi:hypothetical protein PPERSA_10627 [Pseudocohnilembus persalinus]|uniref:Serine hydrolase domain-containing protein n=1 Tax=Pseudocohnilembus persalinus TaxID=266149 RepID=A0A0V0QDB3_PSEPJ|nr:hypothetical protein PPERSA_10627 [Pseudocohnilembus persalinus]|eukprot:KRX00128.1 hypothetical protein PPERSA_10627 [Pseudocohnilembus persalinus]